MPSGCFRPSAVTPLSNGGFLLATHGWCCCWAWLHQGTVLFQLAPLSRDGSEALVYEVGVVMAFGNKGIAYRSFVAVGRDQVKAVNTPASAVTASYSPFASC